MSRFKTICICGGGGQCHAIAPWLASQGHIVNILTNHPEMWNVDFKYLLPNSTLCRTKLGKISSDPSDVIPSADVVILTVPGFINREELMRLKPHLTQGTFVGGVFGSNGFFFEAMYILGKEFPLWSFQRVPFIGKIKEYGRVGNILAYKTAFHIAVENAVSTEKEHFREWIEKSFGQPTHLMSNFLEVTLSNSNPLLHPARIYTWLKDWDGISALSDNQLFYEEWSDEASKIYIALDVDLHNLIENLPIDKNCLPSVLDYYEQPDAAHLTQKLQSIESFKGIRMPVKKVENGWIPDFSSRYFVEDFNFGLKKYFELALKYKVEVPTMTKVLEWSKKYLTNT